MSFGVSGSQVRLGKRDGYSIARSSGADIVPTEEHVRGTKPAASGRASSRKTTSRVGASSSGGKTASIDRPLHHRDVIGIGSTTSGTSQSRRSKTPAAPASRSSKTRQSAMALSSSSHRSSAAATAMDDATMQDQLAWSRNNMRPSAKTATVTTMATLPSSSVAQYGIAEREKSSSGIVSTSTSSEFQDANENSGFAAILRPSSTLYAGNRQSFSPAADSMPVGSKAREHLSPRVTASLSHQPPNLATDHSRYASQPAVIAGQDSNLQHHDSEVVAVAMQGWHDGQQQEDETSTRHPVSHHSFQLDDGTLTEDDLTDDVVLRDGYSAGDDAPLDVSLLDTLATKKQELLQQKKSEKHKSQANRHAREAELASQRKAAIAALKEKRKEQAEMEAALKERILKEEMERVEAKQKEKLAKQKERSRKNVRTASHHVEKSSGRVETIAQENGRQSSASTSEPAPASVDVSSGRKQKPASARPTNRSVPISKTHSDLLAMLELLESEDTDTTGPISMRSSGGHDGFGDHDNGKHQQLHEHSADDLVPRSSSRNRKDDKQDSHLQSILTYLENVEQSTATDEHRNTKDSGDLAASSTLTSDFAAAEEMATANISTFLQHQRELLSQIEEGRSREDDLKLVKEELERQKQLTLHIVKSQEEEMKDVQRKVTRQSKEYDSRIKKLLAKNDQLVSDNRNLQDQCQRLMTDIKDKERRHEQRMHSSAEGHERELKRQKEVILAAENMKREKWKSENAKKIKEVTVKGLEPEIQRLITKHKAELREQASSYEAKIRAADDRAGRRYVTELEELKIRLNVEKESACAKERELARQRFESQLADEEASMQQRTRRLYSELQEEKEKCTAEQHQLALQFQEKEKLLKRSHEQLLRQMEVERENLLEEQSRRHQTEVRELMERLQIEKEAWKETILRKQATELTAKERILRQDLKKERDKEIEMVIGRLELEMSESQEEVQRQTEARINRLRDQHAAEMKEMERSERDAVERYSEMKAQLSDTKAAVARLQVAATQNEAELAETNKVLERLSKERENVTDIVRQDFANRLVATEEENKRMKTELAELTARNTFQLKRFDEEKEALQKRMEGEKVEELQKLQEEKQKEMEALHERIKQAVAKKDVTIANLRTDVQTANKKAEHLNALLQQQRKILTRK